MATQSCSLRVAACYDGPCITQEGATACPRRLSPTPHHPSQPTLRASLLPGLLRAPAGSQQQPGGRLSTAGGSGSGFSPGAIKASLSHSEWSMSVAGDWSDRPGTPWSQEQPCWVGGVRAPSSQAACSSASQGEPGEDVLCLLQHWGCLSPGALGGLSLPPSGHAVRSCLMPETAAGAQPGLGGSGSARSRPALPGAVLPGGVVRVWPGARCPLGSGVWPMWEPAGLGRGGLW